VGGNEISVLRGLCLCGERPDHTLHCHTAPALRCLYRPDICLKKTCRWQMTEYDLRQTPFGDLMQLFYQLEAPKELLDGEFMADLLE
jgi:hypothetical protein